MRSASQCDLPLLLIVDDDEPVRRLVARWADKAGLCTEEAGCAESAIDALQAHRVTAVLTDVDMPGQSGIWLAGWLARNRPRLAVGIMSGRAPDVALVHEPFFEKPLERGDLLPWLQEIAQASPRAET